MRKHLLQKSVYFPQPCLFVIKRIGLINVLYTQQMSCNIRIINGILVIWVYTQGRRLALRIWTMMCKKWLVMSSLFFGNDGHFFGSLFPLKASSTLLRWSVLLLQLIYLTPHIEWQLRICQINYQIYFQEFRFAEVIFWPVGSMTYYFTHKGSKLC